ncbi:hypothetical protein [Clostridium sp.]
MMSNRTPYVLAKMALSLSILSMVSNIVTVMLVAFIISRLL